ncbi:MAG: dihydroorotate dehydrogenase [Candidatus Omnitrophica bacterium]|nr:dihydroorotate dehydrogenase [Candidatus Omnitrophota bacterium]MDD5429456.1 dihydroorotate dehydrogenase [Candidatus Omnitrophota bacterium]
MELKVKIGKLKLRNPIICASGTFGSSDELKGLADYASIGAVTAKTITLNPCPGNCPPRIYETGCGVINSVGLEGKGLENFIAEDLPRLSKVKTEFILSIGGFSINEYKTMVKRLSQEKAVEAIELNLSCPNIKRKKIISQSRKDTYETIKILRGLTKKTLIAKITPEVTDIKEIAVAACAAGADAISTVNTFFGLAVNIQTGAPYLGNCYGGYSGRAIKPMALYRVWKVSRAVKIPVIGGGGIETADDALEFIIAGATAISLGTVNFIDPAASVKILRGIKNYLKKKKINNINQLRGSLDA